MTSYNDIYTSFFNKITDDMYMELTKEDTEKLVCDLLINAIPWFEFPRVDLDDRDDEAMVFNINLSKEEINILSTYMIVEWMGQQLASIENIRMKYSGSDFKFTSQANHLSKVQTLKNEYERIGFHLQRLYKRRKKDANGIQRSTFDILRTPRRR